MANYPRQSSAPAENLEGKEKANALYNEKLKTAGTIGGVRGEMQGLLSKVKGDKEAEKQLGAIHEGVKGVSNGGENDNVVVAEDLGARTLGIHNLRTRESKMAATQLTAEQIAENTHRAVDTALHENSEEHGHKGQSLDAKLAVVDEQNQFQEAEVGFEGEVVANVAQATGKLRPDLPQKTYKEGYDFVHRIGLSTVREYARGAKVGEHLQVEVWRRQPKLAFATMVEQGAMVGMRYEEVRHAAIHQLGRKAKDLDAVGA